LKGWSVYDYIAVSADSGAYFNDLHVFDPVILEWWDLSNSTHGKPPSPRCKFGIAAASGRLYIFGGASPSTGFAFFPASFVDANGQTRFPVAKSLLFSVQCVVTHV
jgi:hypothetical protein